MAFGVVESWAGWVEFPSNKAKQIKLHAQTLDAVIYRRKQMPAYS